jgi:hypothetical protein
MLIVRFSTFKRIYSILLVKTNKKPMKRIVAHLLLIFTPKLMLKNTLITKVSKIKTTILLLLQTLRFFKSKQRK